MKTLALILSILLIFSNVVVAGSSESIGSQEYLFILDYVNCLYKMELAAGYDIKDVPSGMFLKKLQSESACLGEAKIFMEKWLDSPNEQLKIAAWHMYGVITVISRNNSKLIELLLDPLNKENAAADIKKSILEQKEYWNLLYESTGYAIWAVIKEAKSKQAKQQIPFIISKKERKRAVDHLNHIFKSYFLNYNKYANLKRKGAMNSFSLEIPVWSALYLRALLSAQVYADIDKIDYLKLNP